MKRQLDHLVAKFPQLPAFELYDVLAMHGFDLDAAIAHLLSFSESTGQRTSAASLDAFNKQASEHAYLSTMADNHLKKQVIVLKRQLADRVPPGNVPAAPTIAEALLAVNRNMQRAQYSLLEGITGPNLLYLCTFLAMYVFESTGR